MKKRYKKLIKTLVDNSWYSNNMF